MSTEIIGKIIAALEPVGGVSKSTGNPWKAQSYVIETQEQYPKKVCFEVFGEDRINQFNITEGEVYTVAVDIESHEYNGRWYNDVRVWRISPSGQPSRSASPMPEQAPAPSFEDMPAEDDSSNDLPF